jgi:hypothetical protein
MNALRTFLFALVSIWLVASAQADDSDKPKLDDAAKTGASARTKRNLRWHLDLGPSTGKDYLEQVATIGMYLVVADKAGNPKQVADLKERPAKLAEVDIRKWNRNWFTDDNKESCASVAEELRLDFVPVALLFFYPREFEDELVKKELAFKGRKEAEIKLTKFKITIKDKKPLIEVVEQEPIKGEKKP